MIRIFLKLIPLCALFLTSVGCRPPLPRSVWTPQQIRFDVPEVTCPLIRDEAGVYYVDVRLNGQGPYRLLVDTGAYGLLLAEDVAQELSSPSVKHAPIYAQNTAGQRFKARRIVTINTLQLEALTLQDIHAFVHKRSVIILPTPCEHDGILGIGLFYDMLLVLDLPQQELRVSSASLVPQGAYVTRTINAPRFPPCISLEVQPVAASPRTCAAIIDTGANTTVLPQQAQSWPLAPTILRKTPHAEIGGNTYTLERSRIRAYLRLGDTACSIVDPVVGFHGKQALLDCSILRHMILIFDQQHQRAALVPDDQRQHLPRLIYKASQKRTSN